MFLYVLIIVLQYSPITHGGLEIVYTHSKEECELIFEEVYSFYVAKPQHKCLKL